MAALVAVSTLCQSARAQPDTYHISATEKAACIGDATRLCSGTYPDEGKLLTCMSANRGSLTKACLVVFDAGLKRRRIVVR